MEELITPEQVKVARALLAWSQQMLAQKAGVATSTLADFERGFRVPSHSDVLAISMALESVGLKFTAGGIAEENIYQPVLNIQPGTIMHWINATHLSVWGESRDGQSNLPKLLRRLIFASVGPSASVLFPSDESVHYSGWDGQCRNSKGSAYVPEGISGWELGTQRKSIKSKAEDDYRKRTLDPLGLEHKQTNFIFVTTQRFPSKNAWVKEKKAQKKWLDVRVIDADDLVHWLEMYPSVAYWLSMKIGHRPEGLRNIEEVWEEWIHATTIPITPDILLCGRDEEHIKVLQWLREPAQPISIKAEAPDEGMAFLYAAISILPESYRVYYWSRCVIVDNAEAARQLKTLGTPLIVIMTVTEPGLAQTLVNAGHHVCIISREPLLHSRSLSLSLPRPWRHDLKIALIHAGFSHDNAHRYARSSGRSITVLRRLMPTDNVSRPSWAENVPPALFAAMFAGAWDENSQHDKRVISELAGSIYEQVEEILAPLAASAGGPLVRTGSLWKVVSLHDLWTQIGHRLTASQLKRFETIFYDVMSSIDPLYEEQAHDPYIFEYPSLSVRPSDTLRRGLTEAMIALSVFPEIASLVNDIESYVDAAISKLLKKASGALWWSLSRDFQHLAEAAPVAFLDALEEGLEGEEPPIMSLFRSDPGLIHPTEYLSNLLWSLEMLARSPVYLMKTALLLAWLDELDPGGRLGNRPAASLRKIFVSWSPQTYANSAQRMKVVDRILAQHPAAGWKLLIAIAPRSNDISEPSSNPDWRDFAPDEPESVTRQSLYNEISVIGGKLLKHTNGELARWTSLLVIWNNFDPLWRASAATRLAEFAAELNSLSDEEVLWNELRRFVQRQRNFEKSEWALPEEELIPLDAIINSLTPSDSRLQFRWLFQASALDIGSGLDWKSQQKELAEQQKHAAEILLKELSKEDIVHFISTITRNDALGVAIALSSADELTKYDLMKVAITSNDSALVEMGNHMLYALASQKGDKREAFIIEILEKAECESWGKEAEILIFKILKPQISTWKILADRSDEIQSLYWQSLSVSRIEAKGDFEYAASFLITEGRGFEALSWLACNLDTFPDPDLVVQALYAGVHSSFNDETMPAYYVGLLIDYLETSSEISTNQIIQFEWIYYQLLRHSQRPARKIFEGLASDPEQFVYLIKMLHSPEESSGVVEPEPESKKNVQELATQAFHVLNDWKIVPGTTQNDGIDAVELHSWVTRARKSIARIGRQIAGDRAIGNILSAASCAGDIPWPPEAVREVIELVRSRDLEYGFKIGVFEGRGVTVRMPHDGGKQERALAVQYIKDADIIRFEWPRTANCLDEIAQFYEHDARDNDIRSEQGDWM